MLQYWYDHKLSYTLMQLTVCVNDGNIDKRIGNYHTTDWWLNGNLKDLIIFKDVIIYYGHISAERGSSRNSIEGQLLSDRNKVSKKKKKGIEKFCVNSATALSTSSTIVPCWSLLIVESTTIISLSIGVLSTIEAQAVITLPSFSMTTSGASSMTVTTE